MESQLIETPGGRTKIRVYEGGAGEDVLFLHGAGGLLPDDPFLETLAASYRVHAPLLPGYQDSEGMDVIETMLDHVLHTFDVMDVLGLEEPIVVGHSMGGMIAAEMAALNPERVKRLVLVSSAGLWLDDVEIPDIFTLLPFEMPGYLFHDPEMGESLLSADRDMENPEFLQGYLIDRARSLGQAGKLLFPIPDRGLSERLYRVKAKTKLVWGESDRLVPPAYGDAFKKALPAADLVKVPEAGHMVPYEKPEAVIEAISALA